MDKRGYILALKGYIVGYPKEKLNKIGFMHNYEIIYTKKQLGYLIFQNVVNFWKNPGLPRKGLNKIRFIYIYKIIHT